jgi:hypothetical protein
MASPDMEGSVRTCVRSGMFLLHRRRGENHQSSMRECTICGPHQAHNEETGC